MIFQICFRKSNETKQNKKKTGKSFFDCIKCSKRGTLFDDVFRTMLELESDKLIKKGKQELRLDIAVRMLQAGKYAIDEISDISGLTPETIYELKMEKKL